MAAHRFKIGDNLRFMQRRMGSSDGSQFCKVVRLLPAEEGQPQYRIKCTDESVERVVKEHALSRHG